MVETSLESLLADYDAQVEIAVDLAPRVSSLITDLLRDSSLRAHSVSARVKTRESMARKLSERNPPYSHLDEITDVIGIRIITYFDDDVDLVASTIEANFDVDADNSVDKRSLLEPDRFGYLSVHYVATLSETRASLREWARFADRKFEIQIRSILQHAWAEIEHDLGYKSAIAAGGGRRGVHQDSRRSPFILCRRDWSRHFGPSIAGNRPSFPCGLRHGESAGADARQSSGRGSWRFDWAPYASIHGLACPRTRSPWARDNRGCRRGA